MTEKRNKYDTDPLDPDFVRRTEALRDAGTAEAQGAPNEAMPGVAPQFEEPTRRFDGPPPGEQFPSSYPSVFVPPVYNPPATTGSPRTSYGAATPPPAAPPHGYAPRQAYASGGRPSSRPVEKLGVPENWANILPYAPFYIGLVVALIELLVVPRTEARTRFHAAQGLALHIVILGASFIMGFVGLLAGGTFGRNILYLAALVFLIISMCRVWQGRTHHIAPLDELTKKINERFEPRS